METVTKTTRLNILEPTNSKSDRLKIWRVDTSHGYLHEQKFWQTPEPIKIPHDENINLGHVLDDYKKEIQKSWDRYRGYYISNYKK